MIQKAQLTLVCPLDIDELPCNEQTELSTTLLNLVEMKQQKELIMDEVLKTQRLQWPERGAMVINEFKIELLANMAFLSLLPDGKEHPLTQQQNAMLRKEKT